ncbi:uncharacterized protein LOC132721181 [Ruditapes philippinarum]|uniref:uncharacterized protein LOC132721181 n=1 Tax=Ruditapes philippinarum TaxID=129788 RepID=UPI00295A87BE|nr:uncharacterized protein LOC132721181 [Ruditapes philippinarum]
MVWNSLVHLFAGRFVRLEVVSVWREMDTVHCALILRPRRQICKNDMKHGDDGWMCGWSKPLSDRVLEYLTCIVKVDRDYQFFESPSAYILARRIWYGIAWYTSLLVDLYIWKLFQCGERWTRCIVRVLHLLTRHLLVMTNLYI